MLGTPRSPSRFSSSLACGENRQPMRLLFCQVRLVLALLALLAGVERLRAADAGTPPPFYDVVLELDIARRQASVCARVTWVNPGPRPAEELCFNAHAHYRLP